MVVVNGAEGEPASFKDRILMAHRPHLVVDGAILAAEAVGADEIVFYVGRGARCRGRGRSRRAIERAEERAPAAGLASCRRRSATSRARRRRPCTTSTLATPARRPRPPRVSERGVGGRPTLVQNVESLAYAALIARFGERWYRSAGRLESPGTALVTVTGSIREQGVREIELGTTIGEIATEAGARVDRTQAVVLGGYFGTWAPAREAWDLPLDPAVMRSEGLTFGCGIVGLLASDVCGVSATAQIMGFLAKESAGQCGPCLYGLRALGDATARVATGGAGADELEHIERWTSQIGGRGRVPPPGRRRSAHGQRPERVR